VCWEFFLLVLNDAVREKFRGCERQFEIVADVGVVWMSRKTLHVSIRVAECNQGFDLVPVELVFPMALYWACQSGRCQGTPNSESEHHDEGVIIVTFFNDATLPFYMDLGDVLSYSVNIIKRKNCSRGDVLGTSPHTGSHGHAGYWGSGSEANVHVL
jgi:hypothetical protein